MAVFETPSSRKRRISSSLPSSRETPSEPFGRPSFRREDLARARPSRVRSEMRSRSTSANSAKSVVMTLVWMSRLPSTRMFSFSATKATPALATASRILADAVSRVDDGVQRVEDSVGLLEANADSVNVTLLLLTQCLASESAVRAAGLVRPVAVQTMAADRCVAALDRALAAVP